MEPSTLSPPFRRSRLPVGASRLRLCSDEQLVERFRAGRDEAFTVIHDRYRARLFGYVRQMLVDRSSEDVEDALQDVFERAAKTLRAGGAPIGLRPWLYSVARNRCIDELRRRPPTPPDVFAASRPPAGDTSAVAERRADVEGLFRDLRALPELQRSALLMRELQGLSHAELGQVLDTSVPAVKSLLVRARVGLVDAEEARGAPCATIRHDLASAYDRRVKASAQSARHLRECTGCRAYRAELRRTSRRLAALVPGPALFPVALIARLLGGSGVHGEAPAVATAIAGSGGAAMAGAGKLAVLLSVATVAGGGAMLEHNGSLDGMLPWSSPSGARHARAVTGSPLGSAGRPAPQTAGGSSPGSAKPHAAAAPPLAGPVAAARPPGPGAASAAGGLQPPSGGASPGGPRRPVAGGQPSAGASPHAAGAGAQAGSGLELPSVPAAGLPTGVAGSTAAGAVRTVSQGAAALPPGAPAAVSGAPAAVSGAAGAVSGAAGAVSGAPAAVSGANGAVSGAAAGVTGAPGAASKVTAGLPLANTPVGPVSNPAASLPPVPSKLGGVLP